MSFANETATFLDIEKKLCPDVSYDITSIEQMLHDITPSHMPTNRLTKSYIRSPRGYTQSIKML